MVEDHTSMEDLVRKMIGDRKMLENNEFDSTVIETLYGPILESRPWLRDGDFLQLFTLLMKMDRFDEASLLLYLRVRDHAGLGPIQTKEVECAIEFTKIMCLIAMMIERAFRGKNHAGGAE